MAIKIPKKKPASADALADIAARIKKLIAAHAIEIGGELLAAKKLVPHGQWEGWLATNFSWSLQTARDFMNAAKLAAKNPETGFLKPSAIVALAAPNVPESVVAEVVGDIKVGKIPTPQAVQKKIAETKITSQKAAVKLPDIDCACSVKALLEKFSPETVFAEVAKAVGLDASVKGMNAAFPHAPLAMTVFGDDENTATDAAYCHQ